MQGTVRDDRVVVSSQRESRASPARDVMVEAGTSTLQQHIQDVTNSLPQLTPASTTITSQNIFLLSQLFTVNRFGLDIMDALKNPTNLGTSTTSQQSGEEPVSGEKGTGTATEPYDQGNAEG